ncbi:unnamed protein product [Lampetra fluviatilis]
MGDTQHSTLSSGGAIDDNEATRRGHVSLQLHSVGWRRDSRQKFGQIAKERVWLRSLARRNRRPEFDSRPRLPSVASDVGASRAPFPHFANRVTGGIGMRGSRGGDGFHAPSSGNGTRVPGRQRCSAR